MNGTVESLLSSEKPLAIQDTADNITLYNMAANNVGFHTIIFGEGQQLDTYDKQSIVKPDKKGILIYYPNKGDQNKFWSEVTKMRNEAK